MRPHGVPPQRLQALADPASGPTAPKNVSASGVAIAVE